MGALSWHRRTADCTREAMPRPHGCDNLSQRPWGGASSPSAARRSRSAQGRAVRRTAIPGVVVCIMHGGAAPQVAAAARRRLVEPALVACERMAAYDAQLAEAAGIQAD